MVSHNNITLWYEIIILFHGKRDASRQGRGKLAKLVPDIDSRLRMFSDFHVRKRRPGTPC